MTNAEIIEWIKVQLDENEENERKRIGSGDYRRGVRDGLIMVMRMLRDYGDVLEESEETE